MLHVKLSVAVIDQVQTCERVHPVFFGQAEAARVANVGRLAENDRLLILSGVRVRNLALQRRGILGRRHLARHEDLTADKSFTNSGLNTSSGQVGNGK